MRPFMALILLTTALSACANNGLRDLRNSSNGPDEFIIEPKRNLEQPDSFASLPTPTPGQANLTDKYPLQEAVVAVGGRPVASTGPIPSSDGALVQAASRYGVPGNIRETVALEDAEFRKRRGRFTNIKIIPVDRYVDVYKHEALDSRKTAADWRRAGAKTPSYPPSN